MNIHPALMFIGCVLNVDRKKTNMNRREVFKKIVSMLGGLCLLPFLPKPVKADINPPLNELTFYRLKFGWGKATHFEGQDGIHEIQTVSEDPKIGIVRYPERTIIFLDDPTLV